MLCSTWNIPVMRGENCSTWNEESWLIQCRCGAWAECSTWNIKWHSHLGGIPYRNEGWGCLFINLCVKRVGSNPQKTCSTWNSESIEDNPMNVPRGTTESKRTNKCSTWNAPGMCFVQILAFFVFIFCFIKANFIEPSYFVPRGTKNDC